MDDTTTIQIANSLRLRALTLSPEDIGRDGSIEPSQIFGVIVETAYPDALTTLVALLDGSVSLYVSDGNGCIGCGQHREVRASAGDMLRTAEQLLSIADARHDFEAPRPGHARIYLLTHAGLRAIETPVERINEVDSRFGAVYFAAQRLVATIERVGAGHSLIAEINRVLGQEENASGAETCLSVGNVVRRLHI